MDLLPNRRMLLALSLLGGFALVGCTDQIGDEIRRPGMEDPFIVDPSGTGVSPQMPNHGAGGKDNAPSGHPTDPAGVARQSPDPLTTGSGKSDRKSVAADARKRMLDDPGRVSIWFRDPSAKRVVTKSGEPVDVFVQDPAITAPADPNMVYKRRLRKRTYLEDVKSESSGPTGRRPRLGEAKDQAADEDRAKAEPQDEGAEEQRPKRQSP